MHLSFHWGLKLWQNQPWIKLDPAWLTKGNSAGRQDSGLLSNIRIYRLVRAHSTRCCKDEVNSLCSIGFLKQQLNAAGRSKGIINHIIIPPCSAWWKLPPWSKLISTMIIWGLRGIRVLFHAFKKKPGWTCESSVQAAEIAAFREGWWPCRV